MKNIFKISGLSFIVLFIISSCSTPAYVEKSDQANLSDYKTFMWVDIQEKENDESPRSFAYADISVHNAVNKELQKWGMEEVTEDPDLYISYYIDVEQNRETEREAVYSEPVTRYYFNRYTRRWVAVYYPSEFVGYQLYEKSVRDGTLTITLIEAETDKSIWQGWTTERIGQGRLTQTAIEKSVRNIFKQKS